MEGKGREGGKNAKVWMSHGDSVTTLPNRFPFHIMASSKRCPIAAMACPTKKIYGFQFHPEVTHRYLFELIFVLFFDLTLFFLIFLFLFLF